MDVGLAIVLASVLPSVISLGVLFVSNHTRKGVQDLHHEMNSVRDALVVAAGEAGEARGAERERERGRS